MTILFYHYLFYYVNGFLQQFIIRSVSISYDCVIQPSHAGVPRFLYRCIKSFDSFQLHFGLFSSSTAPCFPVLPSLFIQVYKK